MKTRKLATVTGLLASAALVLSACGASNTGGGSDSGSGSDSTAGGDKDWADCTPGEESQDISTQKADENKKLVVGAFNGWDESFAAAHLAKNVLEKDGYEVAIKAYDAGAGYTGLSNGDIDFLMDTWLPITHEEYLKKYGDKIDPQGCWYDNAKLTIAVNEDSPAKTIEDLKSMGKDYQDTIYGIEAGAGLTAQTKEAIKEYDLSNINFKISSTPAMLAQLKKSTAAKEDIAVTLWRPHWAYDAFPVRDLEDPKGVMGKAEVIYNFSKKDFAKDNPKVAQLLKNLVLNDEHLSSLENVMFSEDHYGGKDMDKAVEEWMNDNPDFEKQWLAGELGK